MIELERGALVWGVVGNLGGGKSLTAVSIAVTAIRSGYYVATNITLKLDTLALDVGPWVHDMWLKLDLDDPDFDPFRIPQGSPRGSGGGLRVLVILDEVAEWIDQYSNAKDPRIKRFWSWLRHSSKRSQDVFIICQRQEYINKVVRILIARWIWVDDLAVYRMPFIRIKIPFAGGLVMQNVFDRQGNRISGASFIAKKTWGRFYDTSECLNKDGAGLSTVYTPPPTKKNRHVLLYSVYLLSLLYLLYFFFFVLSSGGGARSASPGVRVSVPPVGARSALPCFYMA